MLIIPGAGVNEGISDRLAGPAFTAELRMGVLTADGHGQRHRG